MSYVPPPTLVLKFHGFDIVGQDVEYMLESLRKQIKESNKQRNEPWGLPSLDNEDLEWFLADLKPVTVTIKKTIDIQTKNS